MVPVSDRRLIASGPIWSDDCDWQTKKATWIASGDNVSLACGATTEDWSRRHHQGSKWQQEPGLENNVRAADVEE